MSNEHGSILCGICNINHVGSKSTTFITRLGDASASANSATCRYQAKFCSCNANSSKTHCDNNFDTIGTSSNMYSSSSSNAWMSISADATADETLAGRNKLAVTGKESPCDSEETAG